MSNAVTSLAYNSSVGNLTCNVLTYQTLIPNVNEVQTVFNVDSNNATYYPIISSSASNPSGETIPIDVTSHITINPATQTLSCSNVSIGGVLKDGTSSNGTSGQVLTSTGTGISWTSPVTYNSLATSDGVTPNTYWCVNCFNSTYSNYTVRIGTVNDVCIAITQGQTGPASVFSYVQTIIANGVTPTVTDSGISADPIPIGGAFNRQSLATCTLYYPYDPTSAFILQSTNITKTGSSYGTMITNGNAYYAPFTGNSLYVYYPNPSSTVSAPFVTITGFN